MKTHRFLISLGFAFFLSSCGLSGSFSGGSSGIAPAPETQPLGRASVSYNVISCNDGDTCRVTSSAGEILKVRLAGVDAPERTQAFGDVAQAYLQSLVVGKDVTLVCTGNTFDRQACEVYLDGLDVGGEMVRVGLAWELQKFSNGKYTVFFQDARAARIGLWSGDRIISPYCFRLPTQWAKRRCAVNPMTPF